MFRALLDRLQPGDDSVQYEVQRMTAQGGWRNFYGEYVESDETQAFEEPPHPPEFGPESGHPPGRFRCVARRDGRIDEIIWTVESPDADSVYERLRERTRQRERLEEASYEELLDAFEAGDQFDQLKPREVGEALAAKRKEGQAVDDESGDEVSELFDRALMDSLESGEISDEDLERLRTAVQVKLGFDGESMDLCDRCYSRDGVKECRECGDLVCEEHRVSDQGVCLQCSEVTG